MSFLLQTGRYAQRQQALMKPWSCSKYSCKTWFDVNGIRTKTVSYLLVIQWFWVKWCPLNSTLSVLGLFVVCCLDLRDFPALIWRKPLTAVWKKEGGWEQDPSHNQHGGGVVHLLTWLSALERSCGAVQSLSLHFQTSPRLSTALGASITRNHIRTKGQGDASSNTAEWWHPVFCD